MFLYFLICHFSPQKEENPDRRHRAASCHHHHHHDKPRYTTLFSNKAVAALVASHLYQLQMSATHAAAVVATQCDERERPPQGRYLRDGAIPSESVWARVWNKGDPLEFLQFLSLTRESFDELLRLCEPLLRSLPLPLALKEGQESGILRRGLSNLVTSSQ